MHYDTAVEINVPPAEVWSTLADIASWADWTPTIEHIHAEGGEPIDVGTVARVKQPKMSEREWRVTEFEVGRSFVWESASPGIRVIAGHDLLTRADGHTDVLLTIDTSGPLATLLNPLIGSRTRRYVDLEGESLKRRCESSTGSEASDVSSDTP